jgi:hypothetical protein
VAHRDTDRSSSQAHCEARPTITIAEIYTFPYGAAHKIESHRSPENGRAERNCNFCRCAACVPHRRSSGQRRRTSTPETTIQHAEIKALPAFQNSGRPQEQGCPHSHDSFRRKAAKTLSGLKAGLRKGQHYEPCRISKLGCPWRKGVKARRRRSSPLSRPLYDQNRLRPLYNQKLCQVFASPRRGGDSQRRSPEMPVPLCQKQPYSALNLRPCQRLGADGEAQDQMSPSQK